MKSNLILSHLIILVSFFITLSSFAQDKSGGNEPFSYSKSANNDGNTISPMVNATGYTEEQMSQAKQTLLNQLRTERINNNISSAKNLQEQLVEMSGVSSFDMNQPNDPDKTGILNTESSGNSPAPPFTSEGDLQVSTIQTGSFWAVATATSHRSSAIFAAATFYSSTAGDEIRCYVSYNGGANWTIKNTFSGFASTVDMRAGELDIEPVIAGADTLLFVVAGYTFNSHALVIYGRVNIVAGSSSYSAWTFGGALQTNCNTYNPKITSDNTNYTSATYLYMMVSADSASGIRFATRFAINTNVTGNTFTVRLLNASGVSFWWYSNGQPLSYLHHDLCYFSSSGSERIYTVYNHSNSGTNTNIYIAWSEGGITIGGSFILTETANVLSAICASNGGTATNVLIGYRRQFNGPPIDWDYRVQHSAASGTSGSFTASYIEFTSDTTLLISMQGVDLGAGRFVTSHARNGGEHFYRKFNNNAISTQSVSNTFAGDVSFGGCRAGYWASSNSDSCIAIWSGNNGSGAYCSRLCSYMGVQSYGNGIPNVHSLSQNYPNPFNPTTNIKFAIPYAGLVKLVVYDILGREVTTLVNQVLNAGKYIADFDASSISSGLYFYTLKTDNFTETKKMLLIK
ncbi:MAG TPA: T9SS type A sorting domain-containing protein [Ignavibacteria bacterium]|nr:T9SS type A sorting domain-containing protein [Ignavibacteria bacterium]